MKKLELSDFVEVKLSNRIVKACEDSIQRMPVGGALLYIFRFPPGEVKETHTHPEIRVTFVRSGRMRLTIQNQQPQEVDAGDIVTMLPGVPHQLEVLGDDHLYLVEIVLQTVQPIA